ncbi:MULTISPECIES: transglutaminase family protein [Acinetobacter]|uniref:transglutaminase family protein n=1 Tax=Acinetobacter TaxID=469 RepID=UPI000EA24B8A|nr:MULTISPECIES: transglutaminase family protein [Acinetobacter]RKG46690.1 transglutaminase family protein [Acinetobacter cumulans]RZG62084.1 transglutaminase family protein [Acinetobacter sp. WCHAc060006]
MKFMVNHQTHYSYSADVNRSIQYIRMTPPSNVHQKVHHWAVSVPGQSIAKHDAFENIWLTSSQYEPYSQLTIMAQGIVELNVNNSLGVDLAHISPAMFLQPTDRTLCNTEMQCFAHQYVPTPTHQNLVALAEAILQCIPYTPARTSVHTTAIEAFLHGEGVCQDHSHVLIAMCKYLGIPARYVSGYLYVPQTAHLASHAWAEAFIDNAWYCFDISNQLFKPNAHIYVAIGRDYWDVAPVRGVREKGGIESMSSIVQVLRC